MNERSELAPVPPAEVSVRATSVRMMSASVIAALSAQTLIAVGTYLIGKDVTSHLDPITVICARSLGSAVVLFGLILVLGRPYVPPRALWPKLILFGLLAGPINQGAFLYGLAKTSAAHASLLYALTPAGVYAGGLLLGRERVISFRIIGILVAFSGVAVLLLEKGLADARGSLVGDAWVAVAVVAWIIVTLEGKGLSRAMGPLKTTAWMLVLSGVWVLPVAFFSMDVHALVAAPAPVLAGVGYLIVLSSAAAYVLWYYALSRAEASAVAVFSNLQPIGTALGAAAFLHEPLTVAMAIGGGLVLLGVRFVSRSA